ncbi:hypothetical protein [Sphingomicrobium flavum]|uniref:hypothetical protein n=1 Tax=Sphingomicrobium flavum TaxID=1229164 RepID=UPI0021ADF847|nr:hypothetical protein [Sphingomicrobium flavum]
MESKITHPSDKMEIVAWSTVIEDDTSLVLVKLGFGYSFGEASGDDFAVQMADGTRYDLKDRDILRSAPLQAEFISTDKRRVYRVSVAQPEAFRVLDEQGLLDFWQNRKDVKMTFKVRAHAWSQESFLAFQNYSATEPGIFSFVIATQEWCLEILSGEEPLIEDMGEPIVQQAAT